MKTTAKIKSYTYKTNGSECSKSLTEWYFGKTFVRNAEKILDLLHEMNGSKSTKIWQDGTGYLTVELH